MESSPCRAARILGASVLLALVLSSPTHTQGRQGFEQEWAAARPVEIAGELSVIYADDPASGRSEIRYRVIDERTGRAYRIHFERQPARVPRSGSRMTLRGRARDAEIYLAAGDSESSWSVENVSSAFSQPVATGEQKTLVIVANFSDATVQPLFPNADCSVPAITERMFGASNSVDALYRELSGSTMSFAGLVAGPFTLSVSRDSACNPAAWADEADALARAAGRDPGEYTRKVYVMPWGGWCGAAGLGEFGTAPSRTWVFNCDRTDLYAHELGHNLGLHHAATPDGEYGDLSDVMGDSGPLRPMNAPHRKQMGWLGHDRTLTVTQEGVHEVAGLAAAPGDSRTRLLHVPGTQDGFYVSYRHTASGFEGNLYGDYKDRTSVHRWAGATSKTYLLALLGDGETFTDPATGFNVTQISHTGDSALVNVKPGSLCAAAAPAVVVSPADQSSPPGATSTYAISLTNADTATCPTSNFALAALVPEGWVGTVTPSTLSLPPGSSGQASLALVSPVNATPATYTLGIAAGTSGTPAHSVSASATHTVVDGCGRTPRLVLMPASQSGAAGSTLTYSVAITNNDPYGCAARNFPVTSLVPAGWSGLIAPSTMTIAAGATGTAAFSVGASATAVSADYTIQTLAAGGTTTASGTFTVVASQDGVAPSAPKNLTGSYKRRQVQLSWQAASDNIGVAGYFVWRSGTLLGATTSLSWRDSPEGDTLVPYDVAAYDAAGNLSPRIGVTVRTSTGGKAK
jgi:hypothetical protein